MAIFASTTLGSSDPSRAMSIKALETRAQALAAAQSKQEQPTSLPSPWQGASLVMNQAADAFAGKRADQAAAQRRQDLAGYMSQVGPEGANPQLLGQITAADPEVGKQLAAQAFQARQNAADIAARRQMAAESRKADEAAAVAQEQRIQNRPSTQPIAEIDRAVQRGEMTPEDAAAAKKKLTSPPAGEQKLINQQQNENIDLQSTAAKLAEAEDLLNKGIYHGGFAGAKTDYGTTLEAIPGGSMLRGATGTDPETTARSKRYSQIMSSEVVAQLKSLKGPASNKDMDWAISTVNDASAPKENKQRALTVLRAQMDAHLRASDQSLKDMGGKKVEVNIPPATAGGAGAAPAAPAAAGGGNPLDEARKAIASGAPKDKVIQRLKEKGIDASGL